MDTERRFQIDSVEKKLKIHLGPTLAANVCCEL